MTAQRALERKPRASALRSWLRVFLPTTAVIALAFLFYGREQSSEQFAALTDREQTRLRIAERGFTEVLTDSTIDLRVIAATPAVQEFVTAPGTTTQDRAAQLLSAFIREDWLYDQLRLLDASGREIVRVNRTPDGPRVVPDAELQDKSDREYFLEVQKLDPGVIHISKLDLNVENGALELPYKPVMRLSMLVSGGRDRPNYVLVANLRGAVLLKTLQDVLLDRDGETWLLDRDGYWLMHPDPLRRWGAQLNPAMQIQKQIPALSAMFESGDGTALVDGELFIRRLVSPLSTLEREGQVNRSPSFDLVSRVAEDRVPSWLPVKLWLPFGVVLLLSAVGIAVTVRLRSRSAAAELQARRLLEDTANTNETRAWIREHIYQLSLKIHACNDSASFGTTVLAGLTQALGLTAGCLYAVEDQRARPVAASGLAAGVHLREFGIGEGLIGEAVRTREDRRMTPPPPGYLDVSGGLGEGPPADLRVLPLWVHGRTVGVIELAFAQVPAPREEELLRQVLPLLSLNLDGFINSRRRF